MQKTYICKYCGKQFIKNTIGGHTTYCNANPNNKKVKHYYQIVKLHPNMTKQKLKQLYIDQEKSVPQLALQFGMPASQIIFLLTYYGIPQRTLKEAVNTKQRKERIKQTNIKRYGVENASQNELIKNKIKETFLKKYGVENVFASEQFKQKYQIGEYTNGVPYKQWRAQKNKKYWNSKTIQQQQDWCKKIHSGFGKTTRIELLTMESLDILDIDFQHQFYLNENNKVKYAYDFKLVDTNILLEINGDYWHANPVKYHANDIIHYPGNKFVLAQQIWKRDRKKIQFAKNQGYIVIVIWEMQLNKQNPITLIKEKINEVLNESIKNN